HAMRSIAGANKMFAMMCERALSRYTQGSLVTAKKASKMWIADSWVQIEQFRLLVMYTAWLIDSSSTAAVRQYAAAGKVLAAEILPHISMKTTHIHRPLGVSNAMGLGGGGGAMGLVDGPPEVHKFTIARQVLSEDKPHAERWPAEVSAG